MKKSKSRKKGSTSKFTTGDGHSNQGQGVDKSEATSASTSSSSSRNNEWDDWDPMREIKDSLLNATDTQSDGATVGKLLTGVGDLELKDILCPHNDDKIPGGGCYKTVCPYKHVPYSNKALQALPKLHAVCISKSEQVCTISSLPIPKLPANDSISKVVIPTAFSPDHFYVIPERGWNCLCNSVHECEPEGDNVQQSYDTLEQIQSSLENYFRNPSNVKRQNEFMATELVAVRMLSVDGTSTWYRAKVLEDAVMCSDLEDDLFKPVDVHVQLLDYGLKCVKNALDVVPLPTHLNRFSPLAFKCRLYGISPIIGLWSKRALERFRQLVMGHSVIAEVVKTASPSVNSLVDEPCLLNLYVKSEGNKYIDVTQDLLNAGFGIEWNLYCKRSSLNELLKGRQHSFALDHS